jgi:vancomycin permeability regulator SanA
MSAAEVKAWFEAFRLRHDPTYAGRTMPLPPKDAPTPPPPKHEPREREPGDDDGDE